MRKALVVGVDHYSHISQLFGCVNDAHAVKTVLERHSDGTVNFDVRLFAGTGATELVQRGALKDGITELFRDECDIALFYFAGHGHVESTGGYICGGDSRRGDDGVSLGEVITLANTSKARNKIVILDSCHSGVVGTHPTTQLVELTEGMTILTASTKEQYASEANGRGVFTTLLVDAMMGAAGNLVGDVTPGSVYAHIDQSLGSWEQRPVFKTNVKSFVSLRNVQPPIALADLQRIVELFPIAGGEFRLDPSFEPELAGRPSGAVQPNPANTSKFAILQKYNRVNLVVPVGAQHMWHAAMESRSCKLTVLGEHYRRLVEKDRI
jgi:hypothetical protein